MKTIFSYLGIVTVMLLFFCLFASADFVKPERPTFSLSSGGDTAFQHWSLTGIVPRGDWFGGLQWTHAKNNGERTSNDLRARIEGMHHWDIWGVHAFGRYGKRSVMAQKHLFQGGLALDLQVVHTDDVGFHVGVGTYAEHETLEAEYQSVLENASLDFGPRGHLNLRWRWIILQNEVLLRPDFKPYKTHSHFEVNIPLVKLFFFEQISLLLAGGLEYNLETKHREIDALQWHWAHMLRWGF